ncbi:hypothetical protein ABS71_05040 [bacterium SCN 62-11]|nr:hypothetical protein [Candidatus Eremiobacteraeota bacterium]ODT74963.1 MAG: hypothetical protein ABS71_05040 [bacterium SCN 62-11]
MPEVSIVTYSKSSIWLIGLRTLSQLGGVSIVSEAASLAGALQSVQAHRPQALVGNADDLTFEFLEHLRGQMPGLKVVVIEGDARSPESRFEGRLVDIYLRRSISVEGLRDAILAQMAKVA